jgi:hypothetical protein
VDRVQVFILIVECAASPLQTLAELKHIGLGVEELEHPREVHLCQPCALCLAEVAVFKPLPERLDLCLIVKVALKSRRSSVRLAVQNTAGFIANRRMRRRFLSLRLHIRLLRPVESLNATFMLRIAPGVNPHQEG